MPLLIAGTLALALYAVIMIHIQNRSQKVIALADRCASMTPVEFYQHRNVSADFRGIYILYDWNLAQYYIGRTENVYATMNRHFMKGLNNSKIYEDYEYGHRFDIKLVKLEGSGFMSLDRLEKAAMRAFEAKPAETYRQKKGT